MHLRDIKNAIFPPKAAKPGLAAMPERAGKSPTVNRSSPSSAAFKVSRAKAPFRDANFPTLASFNRPWPRARPG